MTTAAVVAAVGYLTAVVVLISREPPVGEPTPTALAAAYQQVLATRDRDAIGRLVRDLPEDDATGDALLHPSGCAGGTPAVRAIGTAGGQPHLLLDSGGRACGQLPIAVHDGRWLIDPWARPFHQP